MKTIWILTYTVGGILEEPEIYFSNREAKLKKRKLLSSGGLKEYDEVEIFSKKVKI